MSQAFAGVRILDFSQVIAGPGATQLLGMLGAEIVKIESPGSGDQLRTLLSTRLGDTMGMSPAFMSCNFGKRSLALDLKHPAAKEVVTKLIQGADVLIENFRAGVIEKLGFGYDAVRALKPDIVYCSVTGYGQDGPMRGAAAYDGAIQAASGMMSLTGHKSTGPTRTGYMGVDLGTAMSTAFAISSALYRRKVTGEGQRLDVSMLDTAIWHMNPNYSRYLVGGELTGLEGNASPTRIPTSNVYATQDGYIQIAVLSEQQCRALFERLGIAGRLADERFATNEARTANHDFVYDTIAEGMRRQSTAHWKSEFTAAKLPFAEIRDIPTVVADPQMQHRAAILKAPAPTAAARNGVKEVRVVGLPFTTNVDGPAASGPPPGLGEHTDAILSELGYATADIEALRASGLFSAA